MNKININIFIPGLDKDFDLELPINLEMTKAIEKKKKAINEMTEGAYVVSENMKLYEKSTGKLINTNNIVKYSGLTNGCSILML